MAVDISNILEEVNSLCSADKVDINNAIFEEYVRDENFAQHHTVFTEIRNGQLVPIIDARPDYGFLKVSQGNCETNSCEYNSTSTTKKWSPVDYDCRLELCKQDLECDFRKFWGMRCNDFDNMDDAFMRFLADKILESHNASQWRIAYFDDAESADAEYAGVNGLFKQWLEIVENPANGGQLFPIPENEGATIPEQMNLQPDRAYQLFKAMYNWASMNNTRLLSIPGIHFDVTPELAHNYLGWLMENKEVNCCFSATDGVTSSRYSIDNLNYLGIPIVIRHEWSNIIRWAQEQAGADNLDRPHRAVLTYTNNKPVGTCDMDSFRDFDMFYEKKDKKIYIDVATSIDAKVLINSDFAIAI